MNYYEIHPNKKKRKSIKRKQWSLLRLSIEMNNIQHLAQHAIIVSQSGRSLAEKLLAVADNIKNCADAISSIMKQEKSNRYLKLGKKK